MVSTRALTGTVILVGLGFVGACGDSSSPNRPAPASTGGTSGSGGSGGSGGGNGSGADLCAPPSSPTEVHLCLKMLPEDIAVENTPSQDGKGVLWVRLFDTDAPDSGTEPFFTAIYPPDASSGSEVSVMNLPMVHWEGTPPANVYAQAIFMDNRELQAGGPLTWGTWIAGYDPLRGLTKDARLMPVAKTVGKGKTTMMAMGALRKFDLKVTSGQTPAGDGQGPLAFAVVKDAVVTATPSVFGLGSLPCADIATSPTVTGFVFGPGPFWVTAYLDDLGVGGDFPLGSLASLTFDTTQNAFVIPNQLTYPSNAYTVGMTIDLNAINADYPDSGAPVDKAHCSGSVDAGRVEAGSAADASTSDASAGTGTGTPDASTAADAAGGG